MLGDGALTIRHINVTWKENLENTSYQEISLHQGGIDSSPKGPRVVTGTSLSLSSHTHVASEGLCLFDLFLFLSDRVSSSDWPQTCYLAKNDLGFLILQHLPPTTPWDYKCEPPRLVYAVMGPQNRALCTLGKLPTETQSQYHPLAGDRTYILVYVKQVLCHWVTLQP